ncbi:MAG: reverse transcriptase/maturase family protein [Patescibacteria group bacterium]
MKKFIKSYDELISIENLLLAWQEFLRGKRSKPDVIIFARNLITNIYQLDNQLKNESYQHGGYHHFNIADPKPRQIHKASVYDRLLHHALYRQLYPFYDTIFIADSFSCRKGKGTHKAGKRFRKMLSQVGKNNTKTCWVLKCDIKKFFASIDQNILMNILKRRLEDKRLFSLLENIIYSFKIGGKNIGLPLGNLTSQLFVNIYMNEFDQFMKHELKAKYYLRYADDFVILSSSREELINQIPIISYFLKQKLALTLHPRKVKIRPLASGVDFLGWIYFPHHKVLRTASKRRMFRRIIEQPNEQARQSYKGMLKHGDANNLEQEFDNLYGLLNPI